MILQVENVSKSYKNKTVLKDVSFSMNSKEIIALIGPNGAGKTTLMKILSGLLLQEKGSVTICGVTAKENPKQYFSSFSSIIETPALYEMLSGYDNINFIRKVHNCSKEKMEEILSFINIGDAIHKKVKTYSLGMKQRLALGIALIAEPKVLILDEPTNGLDPEGVIEFRALLKRCVEEKEMCVLISSHILSELEKICSRVLFIKNGQLIEMGAVDKITEHQIVIVEVEEPMVERNKLKGEVYIEEMRMEENAKLMIRIKKKDMPKLVNAITSKGIIYSDISIKTMSIESVYETTYV